MKHILTALLLAPLAAIYAADTPVAPQKPSPARNWADEPLLPQFSVTQAAQFWMRVSRMKAPSALPATARLRICWPAPALPVPSVKHADVRVHLEKWVASAASAGLNEAGDPVKLSGAVMAGAVLAQHDAATTGKLQPATRQALDLMWRVQQADGAFNWVTGPARTTVGNRPALWAHDGGDRRWSGARRLRRHAHARAGLEKLRADLRAHPPEHSHQRAMLLLADHSIGGLLTEDARRQTVADLFALQRPDGGWAMASLGNATWNARTAHRKTSRPVTATAQASACTCCAWPATCLPMTPGSAQR